jgi:hypothetical protein
MNHSDTDEAHIPLVEDKIIEEKRQTGEVRAV